MKPRMFSRFVSCIGIVAVFLVAISFTALAGGIARAKLRNPVLAVKNISPPSPAGFVPPLVAIPTVEVGDGGNAAAAVNFPLSGTNLALGAVSSPFRIGANEVSISQYATFLNAVASVTNATNSAIVASLYPATRMGAPTNVSGIARTGSGTAAAPFVYSPSGNANHPVANASWFSAARFANWMHNGATNGADTENGAYALAGETNDGTGIARNAGARWWIPSEDEWFKAAYYRGGGNAAGYHLFPTKSDSVPGNNDPTATNQANFRRFGQTYCVTQTNTFDPAQNYLTPCGFFTNSPGPYGTFDQGGNLDEWTDTAVQTSFGNARVTRGGSWNTGGLNNNSDPRSLSLPKDVINTVGFRLASSATATGSGGLDNSVLISLSSRPNELQLARPSETVFFALSPGDFTVSARALHSDPSQTGPETNFTDSTGADFFKFLSVLVTTNGGIVISPSSASPTLDALDNLTVVEDSVLRTVGLSGIAAMSVDGLESLPAPLPVRITAESGMPGLVPNPSVTYQSPSRTGSISFRPTANASGSTLIWVTVENGGRDENLETQGDNVLFSREFTVTVTPVNDPPTLAQLKNILFSGRTTQQTVSLAGISAGGGESQPLRITATSSDTNIVPNPVVTYTSPQATGSLRVSRVAGRSGLVTVTVRVEDAGLDLDFATASDNRSVTRTFTAAVR